MHSKSWIAGLLGIVIGAGGYYAIGRAPSIAHQQLQPSTPENVGLMFNQDMISNNRSNAVALMTALSRTHFTPSDWTTLRRWVGSPKATGLVTYEVLTVSPHRALALRLAPTTGSVGDWQIGQVQEFVFSPPSPSAFVALTPSD